MATALLRCLFRHLMFYQHSLDAQVVAERARTWSTGLGSLGGRETGYRSASGGSLVKVVEMQQEVHSRRHDHMQRALLLAVKWNQPSFARRMLGELPGTEDYARPLRKMLQQALEMQRLEIVSLLLERPGCSLSSINLCQLYLQEDPYNFLRSDLGLQQRLKARLADGTIARKHSYQLYKEVVGPFLRTVSPLLYIAMSEQTKASHLDLFFWSVFMGNMPLARELWVHVDNPLHCALIASDVFRQMEQSGLTWGRSVVEANALQLESWAISVMELVEEQEIAHHILMQNVPAWRMGALVELALHMKLKTFLAHRHCQSLMDLWWRGGYPGSACLLGADESSWWLCIWIVLPFLNPYLRASAVETGTGKFAPRSRQDSDEVLYGALAQALALRSRERRSAAASADLPTNVSRQRTRASTSMSRYMLRDRSTSGMRLGSVGEHGPGGGSGDGNELPASDEQPNTFLAPAHLSHLGGEERDRWATFGVRRAMSNKELKGHERASPALVRAAGHVANSWRLHGPADRKGFYSVPYVKFLLRAMWHILFLCLYCYVLTHLYTSEQLADISPDLPPLKASEKVFIVWALSLGLEHRQRQHKMRGFGLTAKLPFQNIVHVAHAILAMALLLRLLTAIPTPEWAATTYFKHACYVIYSTTFSVNSVLISLELFTFMWTSLSFGVLAIIIIQMLVDLSLFVVFYAVILLGFSSALLGLAETSSHLPNGGPFGGGALADAEGSETGMPLLSLPLWAMVTDLEVARFADIPLALPLMYAFLMLANVVLVNLLIAMFADTYSRIKKNAVVEYHYQRFLPIFEHNHVVHPLPPPFSLPLLLYDLADEILSRCLGNGDGRSIAESGVEALHRLAAARPSNQRQARTPFSKKYVQRFLKEETETSANTPLGAVRRVEGLISALDERVGHHLERMDVRLTDERRGIFEDEVRHNFAELLRKLNRLPGMAAADSKAGAPTKHTLFWSALGRSEPSPASTPGPSASRLAGSAGVLDTEHRAQAGSRAPIGGAVAGPREVNA